MRIVAFCLHWKNAGVVADDVATGRDSWDFGLGQDEWIWLDFKYSFALRRKILVVTEFSSLLRSLDAGEFNPEI